METEQSTDAPWARQGGCVLGAPDLYLGRLSDSKDVLNELEAIPVERQSSTRITS